MVRSSRPEPLHEAFLKRFQDTITRFESRKAAAQAMGISDSQLYKQVNGVSEPKIHTIARLAKAAGISLDWLVMGSSEAEVREPELADGSGGEGAWTKVEDDSMVPTVAVDDWVWYLPEEVESCWGLYVIKDERGCHFVRRLQREGDEIAVICDNARYRDRNFKVEDFPFEILGPVKKLQKQVD